MEYKVFENMCRAKNVRPADISRETGISKATFSAWKSGSYTPKLEKLQKIADYFQVSIDSMVADDSQQMEKNIETEQLVQYFNQMPAEMRKSFLNFAKETAANYKEKP